MNWTSIWTGLGMGTFSGAAQQQLVDRLASHSLDAVWQRTYQRAGGMRLAEARGYIRARAAAVVSDQVDAELQRGAVAQAIGRPELLERVTEAVISLTIRELVTRPAVHRPLVRAA
jgi:hypothetical protein